MMSMTGFAALEGGGAQGARSWDVRSVNARGLDIRLRLPDGFEAFEKPIRAAISAAVSRGNVSLSLKQTAGAEAGSVAVNAEVLQTVMDGLAQVAEAAQTRGMCLAPVSAADILALRGVMDVAPGKAAPVDAEAVLAEVTTLITAFTAMRADEGAAMQAILSDQVDQIAELTQAAKALAAERAAHMAETFRAAVTRLLSTGADPEKIAQDIATLAIKADVTEEIDRLGAHIASARALLEAEGPIGRKLDFLTQEFNREANTLCSKSQYPALTEIGLALKTVIDQIREQVQNVE